MVCFLLSKVARAHPGHLESTPVTALHFFELGLDHILTGYDHLLFLGALVLVPMTLRQLVWLVSAFSLAHSLTLALSALGVLRVPASLVEPAIALSVVYVACDNLVRPRHRPRFVAAFSFGLIHGCGFGEALTELGLKEGEIWLGLTGFNLGVEAGQLVVVGLLVPALRAMADDDAAWSSRLTVLMLGLLLALRLAREDALTGVCVALAAVALSLLTKRWGYRRVVLRGGNLSLALLGASWFVLRLSGSSLYALELWLRRLV